MIRPSALSRVMACAASYRLGQAYPDTPSGPAAIEGNEAHEWARQVLVGGTPLTDIPDEEMRHAVEMYTNVAGSYIDGQTDGGVEEKLSGSFGGQGMRGTPDVWSLRRADLTVVDLKYGYLPVEVRTAWQLVAYACMLQDSIRAVETINIIIVQPRASHPDGPVRRHSFDAPRLAEYRRQIDNAVLRAQRPNSLAMPGPCCYRCPAILGCTANSVAVMGAMDVAIVGEDVAPNDNAVAYQFEQLKRAAGLIKNRLAAEEEYITGVLEGGGVFPGYTLAPGQSRLEWSKSLDPVAAAAEFGVDVLAPRKPITPTQAISRGLLKKNLVDFMAERTPGKRKLKKIDLNIATRLITQ